MQVTTESIRAIVKSADAGIVVKTTDAMAARAASLVQCLGATMAMDITGGSTRTTPSCTSPTAVGLGIMVITIVSGASSQDSGITGSVVVQCELTQRESDDANDAVDRGS